MKPILTVIRIILGKLILLLNFIFSPKPMQRTPEKQAEVDQATQNLILYQFEACPFCVKVRRTAQRLNLKLELRDAKKVPAFAEQLVQGGGTLQVPCLKITHPDQSIQWMYESSDINTYLISRFGNEVESQSEKKL